MKEYKLILKVLNTSIQNLQFKHIKISLLKKPQTLCAATYSILMQIKIKSKINLP